MATEFNSPDPMSHGFRGNQKKRYTRWNLLPVFALVCAAIATFYPMQTTFDISAVTDRIRCETSERTVSFEWAFRQAELESGWGGAEEHIDEGTFRPGQNIEIHFERIGHGDLKIDCHAHETNNSVGTLSIGDHQEKLPERAVFRLHPSSDKPSLVYVVVGRVSLGNALKPLLPEADSAILHDGAITPIGHSIFSSSRYEADATTLEPGDEFAVDPDGDSDGYGLILVDDRPSMNVTYRVLARRGYVNRFGGTGFEVEISLLSRIKHDSVIQGFWAGFIFIVGLRISRSTKGGSEK
jgi:hypothetical protein